MGKQGSATAWGASTCAHLTWNRVRIRLLLRRQGDQASGQTASHPQPHTTHTADARLPDSKSTITVQPHRRLGRAPCKQDRMSAQSPGSTAHE